MKSADPASAEVTSEVTGIAVVPCSEDDDGDGGRDDPFEGHCFSRAPPGPLHFLLHSFRHFFLHFLSFLLGSECLFEHSALHTSFSTFLPFLQCFLQNLG